MNHCWCCSLQTGGFVIGVLELIGGILGVITGASRLEKLIDAEQKLDNLENNSQITLTDAQRQRVDSVEKELIPAEVGCIVLIIISCVHVLISSVLIHGIRKKSGSLMTIWMIFKVICIIISITLLLFVIVSFPGTAADSETAHIHIIRVAAFLLSIGLNSFFVKVVYDLKNQSSPNHVVIVVQSIIKSCNPLVNTSGGDGLPRYEDLNKA